MVNKQWYFGAWKPNDVPDDIVPVLSAKGIGTNDVKILVKSDFNRDMVRCDCYVVFTESDILVISGSITLKKNEKAGKRPERKFEELSYESYPLGELDEFKVEEQISSARFTAKNKEGSYVLITNLSNTYKDDFFAVSRLASQLKKDGKVTPDEEAKNKRDDVFCPKCGRKYIGEERKLCPKCMDKNKIINRTATFMLKYKKEVAALVGIMILTSALSIIAPYISSGFYYDEVLDKAGKFYGQIFLVLGIIFGTRLLNMFVNIFNLRITAVIAANMVYDLKKTIFASIERLSLSFFTNRQTGGLMTQVSRDAETIYWFFCEGAPYFILNAVKVVVILIIMLIMNPLLTGITVLITPIIAFLMRFLFDRMGKLHAKRWTKTRQMNSVLSDILSGIRVVKAFSKEKDETARFDSSSRSLAEMEKETSIFGNTAFPFIGLLFYLCSLTVLGVGGWMVIDGQMTYGTLLVFMSYMHMFLDPIDSFLYIIYDATDSLNAMSRITDIMDAKVDVSESSNPIHLPECRGKVEFKHVDFSYEKTRKVIDDVSFSVEAGHSLGIVGHTGAGKSTLANLLIRLYDVTSGEIEIDGINVKDIAFDDLRRNVAIVSQETYLFAGTILDNIRYAKPEADYTEVIEAAKIAGAHDFIVKLPDAYSTMIGFGHKDLSGGEKQRVSIARAILRDPRILILDEATAAMDTETERKIQNALERLSAGRTTITIAHRLSTLRDADSLIVIENGKIPEAGTHLELLAKKGIYFKLYKLQLDAMKNIGIEE